MSIDLLSSNNRFSKLNIYIDAKYPVEDEEFETQFSITPKRKSFFDINWEEENLIFIMRPEEYSQSAPLKEKNPNLFLLSFDPVPEKYRYKICNLSKNPTEVWKILELIEHLIDEQDKLNIQKMAQGHCAELFKDANRFLMNKQGQNTQMISRMIEIFLSFDSELFSEEHLENFISHCAGYFSELNLWKELKLATIEDVLQLKKEYPQGAVFPLDWLGLDHFLFYEASEACDKGTDSRATSFAISLLLEWFEKYVAFHPKLSKIDNQYSLWEETLAKIPLPLALINVKGDLVVYNHAFTRLNLSPRDCLQYNDEETIEINGDFFKLNKVEIEKNDWDSFLFLFFNQDMISSEAPEGQNLKSISSQELGIISSSIAHELNNPLAGILAAIGLLELEDWDSEEEEALVEMKTSAKRCKSLVEIFLGFSRTRDQQQKEEPIRNALGQSLDLLRFRMIESDVRIEVDIENSGEPFKRYINLSLCSMILYLVLGEVLTLFNHYRLVLGDQSLKVLKASYKEEKDRIVLTFNHDIELSQKVISSKLIQYLVDVQGLELEIENGKITLSDWKLI